MTTQHLNFDTAEPVEVEVTISGRKYLLKEMSGDVWVKYQSAQLRAASLDENGKVVGLVNLSELEPYVISLCLTDGDGSNVPEVTVRGWKSSVMRKLFDTIKEISGLGGDVGEGEESLKN